MMAILYSLVYLVAQDVCTFCKPFPLAQYWYYSLESTAIRKSIKNWTSGRTIISIWNQLLWSTICNILQ